MEKQILEITERTEFGKVARRIRREGGMPVVVYGPRRGAQALRCQLPRCVPYGSRQR